jgi:hypothetical protein
MKRSCTLKCTFKYFIDLEIKKILYILLQSIEFLSYKNGKPNIIIS